MNNLNKIIKNILILTWVGLSCSILKAEVMITEIFIKQAHGTHTPQYIELYNKSDSTINLKNWSITAYDDAGEVIIVPSVFNGSWTTNINNTVIDAYGYFLISSSKCDYTTFGCYFYSEETSDIIAKVLILPFDGLTYNPSIEVS